VGYYCWYDATGIGRSDFSTPYEFLKRFQMNDLYKELAEEANPGCSRFYNEDWEYNCAAWTGEEVVTLIDIVVARCIAIGLENSVSTKPVKNAQLKLEVVQSIKEYFGIDDEPESQEEN